MNTKHLIAIDPGQHNGMAEFIDGKLVNVWTMTPYEMLRYFIDASLATDEKPLVIFEDSRLISPQFQRKGVNNSATVAKVARNLGMVDGVCTLLVSCLTDLHREFIAISSAAKGSKLSAKQLTIPTEIKARTNQHERDAVQIGLVVLASAKNAKKID